MYKLKIVADYKLKQGVSLCTIVETINSTMVSNNGQDKTDFKSK